MQIGELLCSGGKKEFAYKWGKGREGRTVQKKFASRPSFLASQAETVSDSDDEGSPQLRNVARKYFPSSVYRHGGNCETTTASPDTRCVCPEIICHPFLLSLLFPKNNLLGILRPSPPPLRSSFFTARKRGRGRRGRGREEPRIDLKRERVRKRNSLFSLRHPSENSTQKAHPLSHLSLSFQAFPSLCEKLIFFVSIQFRYTLSKAKER